MRRDGACLRTVERVVTGVTAGGACRRRRALRTLWLDKTAKLCMLDCTRSRANALEMGSHCTRLAATRRRATPGGLATTRSRCTTPGHRGRQRLREPDWDRAVAGMREGPAIVSGDGVRPHRQRWSARRAAPSRRELLCCGYTDDEGARWLPCPAGQLFLRPSTSPFRDTAGPRPTHQNTFQLLTDLVRAVRCSGQAQRPLPRRSTRPSGAPNSAARRECAPGRTTPTCRLAMLPDGGRQHQRLERLPARSPRRPRTAR